MSDQLLDVAVIGGGILGLATTLQLIKMAPHLTLAVLEKERELATHQTNHNSGVIHSGVYYKPGSLKARNCREGIKQLMQYCDENQIPYKKCGKVIIATKPEEISRLEELERRGKANGIEGLKKIDPEHLKEIEPAACGLAALYSPDTAIVDFRQVALSYAKDIQAKGCRMYQSQQVEKIHRQADTFLIQTQDQEYRVKNLINCAGIYADRIAHLIDPSVSPKQNLPFRGEYYELIPEKRSLIRGLIYPVPDPKFPFLGVHLSKTISGAVEAGPNAVLALSREGYSKKDIDFQDCLDFLTYKGFWKMAAKYWQVGLYELYRSFNKQAFLRALQRLVPELQEKDIIAVGSGVRSQVIMPNGTMCDDFMIIEKPRMIHVLNAPSPAATASLAIGHQIALLALHNFE